MADTPSLRPTREWPLLVLAVALVCAVCFPLWALANAGATASEAPSKWTAERLGRLLLGPEQITCYCLSCWAVFILTGRYLEVRRQRRAFRLELLPTEVGVCILPEDARLHKRRVEQMTARGGPYILGNMLSLALSKFAASRSGRDVNETIRLQADVDLGRLVSSMATANYLAWAIPAVGFLGTVRGLASSMTIPAGDLNPAQTLAFIREATGHLNVAFDCTLVALALSLCVMFLLHSVQREEEALVLDCQQYCLEHLASRLYEHESESVGSPLSTL